MIFGLVSMCVAVPFILLQKEFKRLLAYSSVEHVGIIIFAIGIGTPLAYAGALLHVLNNAIAKMVLFLTAGNIRLAYRTRFMRKVSGAIKVIPVSATLLMVGVFAITGWPPFGVFVSEFTIVSAGFSSGNVVAAVLLLGVLAAVFIGFIYHTSRIVFGEPHMPVHGGEADTVSLLLLGALLAALLVLGVALPAPLRQCIQNAAAVLKG